MTASERVCAYLRGEATASPPPGDVVASAREEGVFLLLANRLRELARPSIVRVPRRQPWASTLDCAAGRKVLASDVDAT